MAVKLSNVLKEKGSTDGVDPSIREYEHRFKTAKSGNSENKQNGYNSTLKIPITSR